MENQESICINKSTFFELWMFTDDQTYGVLNCVSETVTYVSKSFVKAVIFYWCKSLMYKFLY